MDGNRGGFYGETVLKEVFLLIYCILFFHLGRFFIGIRGWILIYGKKVWRKLLSRKGFFVIYTFLRKLKFMKGMLIGW